MTQVQKFSSVKHEVLEEQFKLLFDSIKKISDAKNMEDRFNY